MPPIQFVVDRREHNKTLAAALKMRYGLSWSQAKRLVEGRHVKVSGQVEPNVDRRLQLGKRIELAAGSIELPPEERKRLAEKAQKKAQKAAKKAAPPPARAAANAKKSPPAVPVPGLPESVIVYQDDAVVVANKPAGLTTMRHKDEAEEFGARAQKFLPKTLADLLPVALGAPGKPLTAVHRIDRDTSGLVVFARTRAAAEHLTKQFRKHTVERSYVALTRGVPASKRIESVFIDDRGDGRRGSATGDAAGGKRAVTHVRVTEALGAHALVECRLETGRTHQVRIHLGENGTPLCGEKVYDRPLNGQPAPDGTGAKRPMLHAARLGFVHPVSGTALSWEAPPPADFAALLTELRQKAT
ncbi:ribosomal large subunit pseudouridine synthase d : Pseudouridine synthase OS=Pirellula staleyi (strain ATCC 27377 / DSM 6068 / ICPB 4128) GN=Psta_0906 PE=3 SV=1: PseudoU_synth_2 [Gemmataceae bacterium]|nr:ribosomal large subunit pseudouridine synthase d : Pseudouridine synthase OS=Pirellula staleyi (strain ATCC 27377 / DSM 6068 / ICPB 4128) GN=Psta_0906 PE=3 SV=1: PseudoU_synth_2 [Gemmataceae bacterium]VTT99501.1 ribosomal large subunit pseudouridine synthase d : Pseudouridine synthase OS=Pirellula staleyi (strain ATCC 27377 / DSM 6068 / ICPB 4128) GN=Psta_0906 PE=3 SV=1: PseudoU_synth_2 [Gemmataceae bacterium]